jgi:dihydrofolate reductase
VRKIILNVAVTLDGFIEGPNGEFDWCFTDQDYGMKGFLSQVDSILFGRKSYEALLKYDVKAFSDKKHYVLSRSLKTLPKAVVINQDFTEEIMRLKSQTGKGLWLFGGSEVTTSFSKAGLIDEMHLSIHPLLLGAGKKLFGGVEARLNWALSEARPYSSGLVQLIYGRH